MNILASEVDNSLNSVLKMQANVESYMKDAS